MKWHYNTKTGKVDRCLSKHGKCPFSHHFDTFEEAEVFSDNLHEKLLEEARNFSRIDYSQVDSSAVLTRHNRPADVIFAKELDIKYQTLKSKIRKLEGPQYDKWYKKLVADYQKQRIGNTPSKKEAFKIYLQKNPDALHSYNRLLDVEDSIITLVEERKQSMEFAYKNQKVIQDKSYSNASASAYFVIDKQSTNRIIQQLQSDGYEVIYRDGLDKSPGDNFLIRFSSHLPKRYLHRKGEEQSNEVWNYTDASVLVVYKPVQLNRKQSAGSILDEFTKKFA